jgi:non-ribosomal peptide synthetase component F
VVRQPHDEAICAWDGSLSFQQFDHQASRLAYHLQQQGVGPEVLVPLCFDKSVSNMLKWLVTIWSNGSTGRCGILLRYLLY